VGLAGRCDWRTDKIAVWPDRSELSAKV
jgi:hypothetical protein